MESSDKKNVEQAKAKEGSFDYDMSGQENVSFSFNLDLENIAGDLDSNSDGELEIDVSEIGNYESQNNLKRKREIDKDVSVFNKMEEEIERQLDAKAARTNLTVKNVKNILKHVITNEHVMAMVKRRAYNLEDDIIFEPKLTRAKAKELAMAQPDIPWPITPVKKLKGSEVQVLIEEELSEDSSDEEYHPGQDEPSDDDREMEGNSISSDLDSQPSTPAASVEAQPVIDEPRLQIVEDVQYDEAGVFKMPGIPAPVPNESENIGQRTRSKLSLSETPLEQIEQAFLPPDITTDMYDWDWDTDEDWNNFLKDFTQPLTQEIVGEDDPEADPEYNILEDEESDLLDKEELRMDKAVKVTRKELNNLVAELFEFADMFSKENQEVAKKKKSSDTMNSSTENTSVNGTMIELLPVLAESSLPKLVNAEQRALLDVQLCQHVQLMVQHFVLAYMHPDLHSQGKTCKENLSSLRYLSSGENSAFNATNLLKALDLVSEWEKRLDDPIFRQNYADFVNEETALRDIGIKNKTKYTSRFHPVMKKLLLESSALMYPQLLPDVPFIENPKKNDCTTYLASENHLIVLGLDQFVPFVKLKQTKFKNKNMQLIDTIQLIIQYLIPTRKPSAMFKYINGLRKSLKQNPIQEWYETQKVPSLVHCILKVSDRDLKAPKEQPLEMLPQRWQKFYKGLEDPSEELVRKRLLRIYNNLLKPSKLDINSNSQVQSSSSTHCINPSLLNPTVNMLPTMPFLNTPLKSTTDGRKSDDNVNTTGEDLAGINTNSGGEEPPCLQSFENPSVSVQNEEDVGVKSKVWSKNDIESMTESEEFNISTELGKSIESGLHIGTSTQKKEDISESTDKVSKRKVLSTPEIMFDCTSPKNPVKCDEQTNISLDQANVPETIDKPQLRKTTPRLAKIRSAQNMKMMAQILGNKGLSPSTAGVKPRGKKSGSKNLSEESLMSSNGDNEEEIAELMLASTTIKKDTAIRKRAKQARELENIKRLVEAENDLSQEERATKFAVSFLHKLHKVLDPNAEVFKTTVKLFLDYNEKNDALNQTKTEESSCHADRVRQEKSVCSNTIDEQSSVFRSHIENVESTERIKVSKDSLTIDLYKDVCEKLTDYPELHSDFLLFLKPHQAAMIGKSVEHTMLQKMNDFVDIAQIYFAKQPSRLSKVMQAITQLASDTRVDLEKVNSVMGPLLKGHPLVMDTFLQVLPNGKPPESLFASHLFENLTCPPGPQDKAKIYGEDAPELYENIEIPVSASHEDPYGGDNCKCECHNLDDHNLKSRSEHCVSCGTRFLNGRIYLQTSEGLRPAKITFPGGEDKKQEHITRVSLKTAEKFVPATPTRRRKSSKHSPDQAELKPSKSSPAKEGDEIDKLVLKSKRFNKISMKSKERKKSPKLGEANAKTSTCNNAGEKKDSMSPVKTKREERAEKREAQDISRFNQNKFEPKNSSTSSKNPDSDNMDNATHSQTDDTSQDENSASEFGRIDDMEEETKLSANEDDTEANVSLEKMEVSSDSGSEPGNEPHNSVNNRPWTRQEDAILLESIKKEYSENTFVTISEMLGDRTVQQVKERFEILLSLLEKMA